MHGSYARSGGVRHLPFSIDEKFAHGITEADTGVATYAYDKATGTLTAMGDKVQSYMDPRNECAIVANKKPGGDVVVFKINQTTGALTKFGTTVKLDPFVWYVGPVTP